MNRFPARLIIISGLLLTLGGLGAVLWVRSVGGMSFLGRFSGVSALWPATALVLTSLSIGIRWVRWQHLLRRAGLRVPARPSLVVFLTSLLGRATPAYLGELIRVFLLRRHYGVPVSRTAATWILERGFDLFSLAVLNLVLSPTFIWLSALGASAGVFLVAGSTLFLNRRSRERFAMFDLVVALGLTLLAWIPALLIVSVLSRTDDRHLGLLEGAGLFSSSTLSGGLSLLPAGVVATGSVAILEFERLGYGADDAVFLTTLLRLCTMGFSMGIGLAFLIPALRLGRASGGHFDVISDQYAAAFSPAVWQELIQRKLSHIVRFLGPPRPGQIGLDLGCGLGHQMEGMKSLGYSVLGLEYSERLGREAAKLGARTVRGDATQLPFDSGCLDFVYTIGVLHHLPSREHQVRAAAEVARVLKPGGLMFVHETNTRNPLFRFYMGYVFPILKPIDEGIELWLPPDSWNSIPGFQVEAIVFFTFMPDFIPAFLLGPAGALERRLEASRWAPYSVHYLAVLRRLGP